MSREHHHWIGASVTVEGSMDNFHWKVVGAGQCSKCHEPILWAETHKGKTCPVDVPEDANDTTISHFVSCLHAEAFRR